MVTGLWGENGKQAVASSNGCAGNDDGAKKFKSGRVHPYARWVDEISKTHWAVMFDLSKFLYFKVGVLEKLLVTLCINKILELKLLPQDAYFKLRQIIRWAPDKWNKNVSDYYSFWSDEITACCYSFGTHNLGFRTFTPGPKSPCKPVSLVARIFFVK